MGEPKLSLLIASDIHGAVSAAEFLAKMVAINKPTLLLLLGDLLYHGPRNKLPGTYDAPQTAQILSAVPCPVASIRGNCDAEVDQLLLPWTFAENSYLDLDGRVFMAIHGHQLPEIGGNWKLSKNLNVIHGHTHLPLAKKTDGTFTFNPGSLGIPKGGYPPTFGWYDQGHFEVISIDGQVIMSSSL
ncbi:MAG: phosphodiesterase [Deltaproteobacteria bacterium]|jgi:putative phosphoesterase|nr:phosphodiesterase [Deltaproteobacteria bacterium]